MPSVTDIEINTNNINWDLASLNNSPKNNNKEQGASDSEGALKLTARDNEDSDHPSTQFEPWEVVFFSSLSVVIASIMILNVCIARAVPNGHGGMEARMLGCKALLSAVSTLQRRCGFEGVDITDASENQRAGQAHLYQESTPLTVIPSYSSLELRDAVLPPSYSALELAEGIGLPSYSSLDLSESAPLASEQYQEPPPYTPYEEMAL